MKQLIEAELKRSDYNRIRDINNQGTMIIERLINKLILKGLSFKCRCSTNFEHKCPLYIALKKLGIKNEKQLLKSTLVLNLILNGATIKKRSEKPITTYNLFWFDEQQIKLYVQSKMY